MKTSQAPDRSPEGAGPPGGLPPAGAGNIIRRVAPRLRFEYRRRMPRTAAEPEPVARPVPSRPTLVDFLLLLAGVSLSAFAAPYSGLRVEPQPDVPPFVPPQLLQALPTFLLLPLGPLLLWPLFYGTQWVLGRRQPLTWGEWLWGISWLGHLLLIGWVAWATLGEPPAFLNPEPYRPPVGWVVLVVT